MKTLTLRKAHKLLLGSAVFLTSLFTLAFLLFFNGCASGYLPEDAELTVVHLTDLHLSTTGKVTETPWTHKIAIGGYKLHTPCTGKSFELLERAVASINEKIKPDIVVITGDIVDRGDDVEALKKGHEILGKLKCPLLIAKGDHDVASKPENKPVFESVFGKLSGSESAKGHSFIYIPFESNEETFKELEKNISASGNGINFLCMHRMLWASWGMNELSKKYCSTLLSPDSDKIVELLGKSASQWVVLCGHSHTNYKDTSGNVTELCTSSLAEYPHELRIVKVKDGKVSTSIVTLDTLEAQ